MRWITATLGLAGLLIAASQARAQEWAEKMFPTRKHDFDVVARGAEAAYGFKFKNLYKEDIHVAAVRSSCGCATPKVTKDTLKSLEESEIIAHFNTVSFIGKKSAVITVTIDQPFFAEVQLHVEGFIRSDIVLSPGEMKFGNLQQGEGAKQTMDIEYAGRNDWAITDVRTANKHLEAELEETRRGGGRVGYRMTVFLDKDVPAGYFKDQLIVVTNDPRLERFQVDVEGKIESEITVSPSPLFLGNIKAGEEVTKRIVVRGKKPFKVLAVTCDDESFTFETPEEAKTFHLIPVTFHAGKAGDVKATIHIETDQGEGAATDLAAHAQVE
jgi:hypothetical protein